MEAHLTEIIVIFTTPEATIAALRVAATLGRSWNARIRLIAQQPRTYAVPRDGLADSSPVQSSAFLARLKNEVDAHVDVLVCVSRRVQDLARVLLRRQSLVVIGGRRSWWPTRQERLRRTLEAEGHLVVFVNEVDSRDATPAMPPGEHPSCRRQDEAGAESARSSNWPASGW
jgi:hypothetical protein